MSENVTKLGQLIDPEVLAPIVSYELKNAIRLLPLASVDTTLEGRPGSTLTFPAYTYIGDAEDVAEGEAIPISQLGTTTKEVKIKKAGKGVTVTDEAKLSGYGDAINEAGHQIGLAIGSKADNDMFDAGKGATQKITITPDLEGIEDALDIYNDEDDNPVVLFASPKIARKFRNDATKHYADTEAGADSIIKGTYRDIDGVQLVRTRRLKDNEVLFVKASSNELDAAFKLVLKRKASIETARDIDFKLDKITGDQHYAAYLYHDEKVIYGTISGVTVPEEQTDVKPTSASTVEEITAYLDEHGIDHTGVTLKDDLLALVK